MTAATAIADTPSKSGLPNASPPIAEAPMPRIAVPGVMPAPVMFLGSIAQPPVKGQDEVLPPYGKGLVVPKDLAARIKVSWLRHGVRLSNLPKATEAEYDLRALGLVPTAIRDQGNCGSCWDFAGLCAAESAALKAGRGTAATIHFSEQSVLDCGKNGGCDGDWPSTALEQVKNSGVADASAYPYTGREGPCKDIPHTNIIDEFGYVGSENGVPAVQAIKDAVKNYGAIAVAVAVDNAWSSYKTGVFKGTGAQGINHAVAIVGWKDDATLPKGGYWIVRNQWGKLWGEAGYMRCEYGANRIGYGAIWAAVAGGPVPPVPPIPPVPPVPGALGAVTADPATGTITFVGPWKIKGGVVPSLAEELAADGISPKLVEAILVLIDAAKKGSTKPGPGMFLTPRRRYDREAMLAA